MSNFSEQQITLLDKLFLRDNEVDFLNKTVTNKIKIILSLRNEVRELQNKPYIKLIAENKRQKIDLERQKIDLLRVKLELCELKTVV